MDFSWLKEHPYESAGIVFGGALIVYLIYTSSSATTTAATASTATDSGAVASTPDDTALSINAGLTQAQLSAATQVQLSSDQVQLGSTEYNDEAEVALAQTDNALTATQSNNSTQEGIYNSYFATALSLAQLTANTPSPVSSVSGSAPSTVATQPMPTIPVSTPTGTGSYDGSTFISNPPLSGSLPIASPSLYTGSAPYGQPISNGQNLALSASQEVTDLSAFQSAQGSGYKGSYWDYIDANPNFS